MKKNRSLISKIKRHDKLDLVVNVIVFILAIIYLFTF